MRIWFDTEFIDDGTTIDVISYGLARDDGAVYYAEAAEFDRSRMDGWCRENVLPHLTGQTKPRTQIAEEIREFTQGVTEFWAHYAAYDWVALCQLYGPLLDRPQGWPLLCRDTQLMRLDNDIGPLPKQSTPEHHAGNDAAWARDAHAFMEAVIEARRTEPVEDLGMVLG